MVEEVVAVNPPPSAKHAGRGLGVPISTPRRLREITGDVNERLPLSMDEFARVLGGGVVPGSGDHRLTNAAAAYVTDPPQNDC